jgi:hypothetical protein
MKRQKSISRFRRRLLLIMILPLIYQGCKMSYSFTGASISPNVKTVAIPRLVNSASFVVPTLARTITDALRDYFTSQTNLDVVDRNGDLNLEGSITNYAVQPVAIQGNETAAMSRLTITVSVSFSNKTDEKQKWETSFSRYLDFPSVPGLTPANQETIIAGITEQLVQDIFNKAVVNW